MGSSLATIERDKERRKCEDIIANIAHCGWAWIQIWTALLRLLFIMSTYSTVVLYVGLCHELPHTPWVNSDDLWRCFLELDIYWYCIKKSASSPCTECVHRVQDRDYCSHFCEPAVAMFDLRSLHGESSLLKWALAPLSFNRQSNNSQCYRACGCIHNHLSKVSVALRASLAYQVRNFKLHIV